METIKTINTINEINAIKTINAMPEAFDDPGEMEGPGGNGGAQLAPEDILMAESDILAGLLELGKAKDVTANYRNIQIRRSGALKLEFRVRPLTEDETQQCLRAATKYAPPKRGQPKTAIETDNAQFRSRLIYAATVNEDRAKVWDNQKAKDAFGVLLGFDMVDRVLLAGEKSRVLDIIDEISGYDADGIAGN